LLEAHFINTEAYSCVVLFNNNPCAFVLLLDVQGCKKLVIPSEEYSEEYSFLFKPFETTPRGVVIQLYSCCKWM